MAPGGREALSPEVPLQGGPQETLVGQGGERQAWGEVSQARASPHWARAPSSLM